MVDYNQLYKIAKVKDQILNIDFNEKEALSTFETTELFSYIVMAADYKTIQLRDENHIQKYLNSIGFLPLISKIKQIDIPIQEHSESDLQEELFQIQSYTYKPEFYGRYESILAKLKHIGISDDTGMLIGSSLGEIVDNAFSHNIGQWSNDLGPLVILLMQNNIQKRELTISICDFGIGFLQTIKHNYPKITTEAEAINLALKANVTGRPNQKGGNGLLFLQKNVFNGFKGTLSIRSTNTLIIVTELNTTQTITEKLHFTRGVNICFSVEY